MNLKGRLKRLEESTLTENQEQKVSNYLDALTNYLLEETEENYQRLKEIAEPFNFGKRLE